MSWLDKLLGIHSLRRPTGEVLEFRDTLTIGDGLTITPEPETKSNRLDLAPIEGGEGVVAFFASRKGDQTLDGNTISQLYANTFIPCRINEEVPAGLYAVFYSVLWGRMDGAAGSRAFARVYNEETGTPIMEARQLWQAGEDMAGPFASNFTSPGDVTPLSGFSIANLSGDVSIVWQFAISPPVITGAPVLRVIDQHILLLRVQASTGPM